MSGNEFELALQKASVQPQNAAIMTTNSRYAADLQGMVYSAKQFPRDQFAAYQRIKQACERKSLAMIASYEYPRGGQKVTGPSIRLAEVVAQNWGNMTFGVVELEQKVGESTCMAYAWDIETNVRSEKIFTVKHERSTKQGAKKLDDSRDIYELVANMGARRQRACILAIIPKDVIDSAVEECDKTLAGKNSEPIIDRIKKMFDAFKAYGVTREMIEKRIGVGLDSFTEKDLLGLIKVFNSLKDGIGKREDFFEADKPITPTDTLAEEFKLSQGKAEASDGLFNDAESKALDAKIAAKEGK
ncbi:MAG: hypothetical protein M0Z35_03965 [Desulfitobacterium hafniense]|nr:hypothetical protein [Desulfitobacterium hafniense]